MAKLIKCPRCQSNIDVTTAAGNSVIKCPECASQMRVPTGETAKIVAKTEGKAGGRQTPIFRKMAGAKQPGASGKPPTRFGAQQDPNQRGAAATKNNNMMMIIGAVVVVLAIIGAVVVMNNKGGSGDDGASKSKTKKKGLPPPITAAPPAPPKVAGPPPPPAPPPSSFQYGAGDLLGGGGPPYPLPVDKNNEKEIMEVIKSNKADLVIKNMPKYMNALLNSLASDDENTARAAFNIMLAIDEALKLGTKGPLIELKNINSPKYRADMYVTFYSWWSKASTMDLSKVNFDQLVADMKGGGGFSDESTPQGSAFYRLRRMGPPAWPKLLQFLDNEDVAMAQAAASALNELTGERKRIPNAVNRAAIKAEWEEWFSKNK